MATELQDLISKGRDALAEHRWAEALNLLRDADREQPLDGSALECLGEAAYWNGRPDEHLAAYERAYSFYMAAGDRRRAALMAMKVARAHGYKLENATAVGWRARATRLLEQEPECIEHGELALRQSQLALNKSDIESALAFSTRAVELGERFGDRDVWALGLNLHGQALLRQGDVAAALDLIDEACAAAIGGELTAHTTGLVYCFTIAACRDLADYSRAHEWTEAANRWCERQSISGFPGVCRIHRAELLRLRGALTEADSEISRACEEMPNYNLAMAGYAFSELGEIRLRAGDFDGADSAFEQARQLAADPQPGHALLQLARGDIRTAKASIQSSLEAEALDRFEKARLLPAAVKIFLEAGELERARSALQELEELSSLYDAPAYRASSLEAQARVAFVEGRHVDARALARRAIRVWQEVGAPYETASVRVLLARIHEALGSADDAAAELKTALATFERVGARADAEHLVRQLERSPAAETTEQVTFLFSDIVESTNLVEAIGDESWVELVRWHDHALRECFKSHSGHEIDHAGDGFFVAFDDAKAAVDCAVSIQRDLAQHRRQHGFAPRVRIGLHAAKATKVGASYKGKGVHEAARISAAAGPDEILASRSFLELVPGESVGDTRKVALKGIREPVEVAPLAWR